MISFKCTQEGSVRGGEAEKKSGRVKSKYQDARQR